MKKLTSPLLVFMLGLLIAIPVLAVPPEVKTVPWVASNPLIPHDIFNGEPTRLKGASDMQGAGIQFAWDFGDGSPPAVGTVTDMRVIEASHTYTGVIGDVFTARLTVTNTGTGESASRPYYVQIRHKTLETEVNVAIDEGLWWLHKDRVFTTCNSLPCSYRNHPSYGTAGHLSATASAVNAFEANGHLESGNASNPYTETVRYGLGYIFSQLRTELLGLQPAGDPDSNGNGIGIRPNTNYYPYVGGAVMDAIITSGTPGALAPTGPADVLGRGYADIVQDMVDSYAYGQYDVGGARGGWRYSWNQHPDNSAAQWGAIGMLPAEANWGLTVPAWVKTESMFWLDYSQYYTGVADTAAHYGAFGYTGKGQYIAGTASGMVQLAFNGVPSAVGGGRWQAAEKWLRLNWNQFFASGADYYSMFALAKAMRQANPAPLDNLCDSNPLCGSLDWYNDASIGFARRLVDLQQANGAWTGGNRWYIDPGMQTPWSVLILSKSLFEAGSPVAVAEAIPNPAVAGQTITLDGSASFHQDAAKAIVMWEWDFDNDGTFDATGPVVTNSFPAVGDYPVVLRVTDDGDPMKTDDSIVTVRITIPPLPPTADANGPYVFCPQALPWFLDGTGSVNPDEGQSEPGQPGDTIQEYAWDLDAVNGFNDAFGPQPDVTAFFGALGTGDYLIQLRVTDTTATSYPSSGMGDLSDTGSAQVSVRIAQDEACGCVDDLIATPGSGEIQLAWTDTGAISYNIYRSTTSGGPYTLIAQSNVSSYLDTTVTNGVTYYYVVRVVGLNTDELCQSNEASGTPEVQVVKCDIDGDGDIDRDDIMVIFGLRGTVSSPGDPADLDDNGIININDARGCVLRCTLPRCAVQ